MSNSVRPQRRQPTRLPHPRDSPGKNTGVGCHFLLQCMKVKSESEVTQSVRLLAIPWTAAYQAPPSMGFSRLEYWSGVPLPSPDMLERSDKMWSTVRCQSKSKVAIPDSKIRRQRIDGMIEIILLLLLPSHFSCVLLCVTQMAAHQAPPSPGFSRQERWSGLLFPSPMHEGEK